MASFTETFAKTPLEERPALVDVERQRRVGNTPEAYVAVPIIVPKMSSVVQGAVAEYELFWLVGVPGPIPHPKAPEKMAREAINFQCSREDTAEDMVYMLNLARIQRELLADEMSDDEQTMVPPPPEGEGIVLPSDEPELDPSKVEDALTGW